MRIHVLLASMSVAMAAAAPAFAQDNADDTVVAGSVSFESGRIFGAQAFNFSGNPAIIGDVSACHGAVCGGISRIESVDGNPGDEETDLYGTVTGDFGEWTVQGKAMYIIVPGEDVTDFVVTATRPVSDAVSVSFSYEAMRGGFEDNVLKAAVDYSTTRGRMSYSASAFVAHSTWADGYAAGTTLTATRDLGSGLGLSLYGTGFVGDDGETGGLLGVRFDYRR